MNNRTPGPAERRVVYSTDQGRICPECGRPAKSCVCRRSPAPGGAGDGIVRVYRDRRHRHGKTVTVITGVPGGAALQQLAGELKRLCGAGGTARDGVIEIQGDHRDQVAAKLSGLGYRVKMAGG